jgi:hypothetical protein
MNIKTRVCLCLFVATFPLGCTIPLSEQLHRSVSEQFVCDVGRFLKQRTISTHHLLRDLHLFAKRRYVGRIWATVYEELSERGSRKVPTWETEPLIGCDYTIATNVCLDSSAYPVDLCLSIKADGGAVHCNGRVFEANLTLVSNVKAPLSSLIAQDRYPKESVMSKVLTLPEIKAAGETWPLVKRVCVFYGYLNNRWNKYNPSGFTVAVEFVTDATEIGSKRITYTIVSNLDPCKTKEGAPYTRSDRAEDSLGDVELIGDLESWRGEDNEIEIAKAKYLRSTPVQNKF